MPGKSKVIPAGPPMLCFECLRSQWPIDREDEVNRAVTAVDGALLCLDHVGEILDTEVPELPPSTGEV